MVLANNVNNTQTTQTDAPRQTVAIFSSRFFLQNIRQKYAQAEERRITDLQANNGQTDLPFV